MNMNFDVYIEENSQVRLLNEVIDEIYFTKDYTVQSKWTGEIPEDIVMKILIFGYMNGAFSSRKIEQLCKRDIYFWWLLDGFPKPDHCTISRFRKKMGEQIEKVFYDVVKYLLNMGEISGENLFIDGTKLEANANRYTFVWKKSVEKNELKLRSKLPAILDEIHSAYGVKFPENTPVSDMIATLSSLMTRFGIKRVSGIGHRKSAYQKALEKLEEYAEKMALYVEWIKEKHLESADEFVKKLSALFVSYRTEMINVLTARGIIFHNRIPDMLASLKVGFDILLEYLCDNEQIGKDDVISYRWTFDEILIENVSKSSSLVENENISYQFCEKLESLIDSGRCSLNMLGNDTDLGRKGFIGFEDDTHYYLIMNAAMSEINKLSRELGDSFSIGRNNLIQQLADDKIIITNGKRNTTTIRAGTTRMISVAVLDKVRIESLLSGSVCPPTSEVGQVGE